MSIITLPIQIRRSTAAEWSSNNPVLLSGELAFETDTYRTKIGDGSTPYNSLPYYDRDLHFTFEMYSASDTWTITHGLDKYPSVQCFDSSNDLIFGIITHNSKNQLTITFSSAVAGKAYLN